MYLIELSRQAADFLKKADKNLEERFMSKFEALKQNPELGKPLTANLSGLWSLRIGDYRTIYQIIQGRLLILIIKIAHRKDVY